MESELAKLQLPVAGPLPAQIDADTNPLLPPPRAVDRLRHFPEEVYDTSPEGHLARFMMVLLGDSGAGQLRKALMRTRLQQTLQGTHFYALDRFYGALFDFRRSIGELLAVNPQNQVTNDWQTEHGKDASYRSRIIQFARAISHGATPTGMELVAEAVFAVDCDVYESYIQADAAYRTYQEIEDAYLTYADMEGLSYGELEGEGLPVLAGNERREFTIRPKRPITQAESYDLLRVIEKVKPADARVRIDWQGVTVHDPLVPRGLAADSEYWEVVTLIPDPTGPVEPTMPPFSKKQGDEWFYNGDIAGANAYSIASVGASPVVTPTKRIYFPLGSFQDYPAGDSILPLRSILAGRIVSDGILVAGVYGGYRPPTTYSFLIGGQTVTYDLAPVLKVVVYYYVDYLPLELVLIWLRDNPVDPMEFTASRHFWVSPVRAQGDATTEYVEIRLNERKLINRMSFETSHYPHTVSVEVFDYDSGDWVQAYSHPITDSFPAVHNTVIERLFSQGTINGQTIGDPEHPHSASAHWVSHEVTIDRITTDRVRLVLQRGPGTPPQEFYNRFHASAGGAALPYSLAVRKAKVGYRVESYDDLLPFKNPGPIAGTVNLVGQAIQFAGRHQPAVGLLENPQEAWRCEPQPFNYAVVNFFMDARDEDDEPTVIDRFYIDPTHTGCHITIYWSNEDGDPDYEAEDGGAGFFADIPWNPVPRDYVAQKGYLHLPPVRAKWFKFEFTNLVAEPYEVFVPVRRHVKFFTPAQVAATQTAASGVGPEGRPQGLTSAITMDPDFVYGDAVEQISTEAQTRSETSPTSAFYVRDPLGNMVLKDQSWAYGFQPFTQGHIAPRFAGFERHVYQEAEIFMTSKVGYFCGFKEFVPYRLDHEAGDDTEIYTDNFGDARNLEPGMTWNFDPGYLWSGEEDDTEAVSRPMSSLHNVRAVQFATSQSDPIQMVVDDEFRDPALATSLWDDEDEWHKVGDATLAYLANETTVSVIRRSTGVIVPLSRTLGLDQPIPSPVFSERTLSLEDEEAAEELFGGIASGLYAHSDAGRVHAAARVFLDTELTNPLVLQIVRSDGTVLAQAEATGRKGERMEWYVGWTIPDPTPVDTAIRVQVIQEAKSDDAWRVDTLSMFDDGIVWEFSVNGGSDWYPGHDIRNNPYGILSFPATGNQLVYRVRGVRENVTVSGIRIRPHYVGVQNSRQDGTHRGPNVSTFDHDPPIQDDPWWRQWSKPIPRQWFYAFRGLALLPVEGAPASTEFARFYSRSNTDALAEVTDDADGMVTQGRTVTEPLNFVSPISDAATRAGVFARMVGETVPTVTDELVHSMPPDTGGVSDVPVHPVQEGPPPEPPPEEEPEAPEFAPDPPSGGFEDGMGGWLPG